jgi:hypothetical protein
MYNKNYNTTVLNNGFIVLLVGFMSRVVYVRTKLLQR